MADLPSDGQKINDIEVGANKPVTAALFSKMGSSINFLLDQLNNVEEFTTVGVNTFVVPEGVEFMRVAACGGGAGGGLVQIDTTGSNALEIVCGGGGVVPLFSYIKVTPLETLTITVGAGGAGYGAGIGGANLLAGNDGGNTTIVGSVSGLLATFKGGHAARINFNNANGVVPGNGFSDGALRTAPGALTIFAANVNAEVVNRGSFGQLARYTGQDFAYFTDGQDSQYASGGGVNGGGAGLGPGAAQGANATGIGAGGGGLSTTAGNGGPGVCVLFY